MPLSSSRLMYARSQYTSETKHCSGGLDVVCYTAFFSLALVVWMLENDIQEMETQKHGLAVMLISIKYQIR